MKTPLLYLAELARMRNKKVARRAELADLPQTPANDDAAQVVVDHEVEGFADPKPSTGVRVPTLKKAKTARSFAPVDDEIVHSESFLEDKVLTCYQARADVKRIVSQPYKVFFKNAAGRNTHHVLDFLVELKNGTAIAVIVKKSDKDEDMKELAEALADTGYVMTAKGKRDIFQLVDRIKHVSEADVTLADFDNACWVLWAREKSDRGDVAALREFVRTYGGEFRFNDLLEGVSNRSMRRASVWRLIERGVLKPKRRGHILDFAVLKVEGAEGTT